MHKEPLTTQQDSPSLTWKNVKSLVEKLPELKSWLNHSKDLSDTMKNELVKDRTFFRKFVPKIVGSNKEEQVEFLIKQAKKLSSKTYIQAALKLIPAQPDFLSLQKKIDVIMPLFTILSI